MGVAGDWGVEGEQRSSASMLGRVVRGVLVVISIVAVEPGAVKRCGLLVRSTMDLLRRWVDVRFCVGMLCHDPVESSSSV